MASLAAMLVYTGYRLAHPSEFVHVYRIGKEQLAIFVTTLVVVLATDLLIGVAAGIVLKLLIHVSNGVPVRSLFKPYIEVQEVDETTSRIVARESAVFSNWIPFRRQIEEIGLVQRRNLIVDVSDTKLIDHSVMEKLDELQRDFEQEGLSFVIAGLGSLRPFADDAHSARKRGLPGMKRVTVIGDEEVEGALAHLLVGLDVAGFTRMSCSEVCVAVAGTPEIVPGRSARFEIICSVETCNQVVNSLRRDVMPRHKLSVCIDGVETMDGDFATTA